MADATHTHQALLQSTLSAMATTSPTVHPCVICLDEVTERAEAQPCSHDAFDFLCLASWLEQDARCPLCNAAVSAVHYAFVGSTFKVYNTPTKEPPRRPHPLRRPQPHRHSPPRRSSPAAAPVRTAGPDDALAVRRAVYRGGLYSLHVGANRLSRFAAAPPKPSDFKNDSALLGRARTFMRRELQVFEFLRPRAPADQTQDGPHARRPYQSANAEFLLSYLAALLQTVDLQDASGRADELLAEFLGRKHATLFLHELRAWLRSPYESLDAWDRHVQYAQDPRRWAGENDEDENPEQDQDYRGEKRRRPACPSDDDARPARRRLYDRYVPRY